MCDTERLPSYIKRIGMFKHPMQRSNMRLKTAEYIRKLLRIALHKPLMGVEYFDAKIMDKALCTLDIRCPDYRHILPQQPAYTIQMHAKADIQQSN